MRRLTSLLLLLAMFLPFGQAVAQTAVTSAQEPLTLGPGDTIRLLVYQEKEITGEYLVNEEGIVTLPLLGDRRVTGVPVRELRQQLVTAYQAFLRNPAITVTPLRRVSVLGAVVKPGIYSVDPTFSLADAVALAGGANPEGDADRVQIVRQGRVIQQRASIGQTLRDVDIRSGDQILVGRRSWFDRNSTFLVSALLSVSGIVSSIIIARR